MTTSSVRLRGDFSRLADSSTLPAGYWKTRFVGTGATATVANGALRLRSGTLTDGTGGIRIEPRAGQATDNFEVYAKIKVITSGINSSWSLTLPFRSTVEEASGGYNMPSRGLLVIVGANGYSFQRLASNNMVAIVGSTGGTYGSSLTAGNVIVHVRYRVQGSQLLARAWNDGSTEPTTWPARAFDTQIPRKGMIAINLNGGTTSQATVEVQEFTISDLERENVSVTDPCYTWSTTGTIPADAMDSTQLITAASGNVTRTLPAVTERVGKTRTAFKRIDSSGNTVTIAAAGSDTIDGASSYTLAAGASVTLIADGTTWWILGGGGGGMQYIGTTAAPVTDTATARPVTAGPVYWLCGPGVTPTNALDGDLIVNKSA